MKIGNLNISNFKVGSTQVVALWLGNTKIWPTTPPEPPEPVLTTEIVNEHIVYSSGSSSSIDAAGEGYALIKADIKKYEDGVLVETITNVTLEPSLLSTSYFYKSGNQIKAYDRDTTPGAELSASVYGIYEDESTDFLTVCQEPNIESTSDSYRRTFIVEGSAGDIISVPHGGGTYNFTATSTKTTTKTYTSGKSTTETSDIDSEISPTYSDMSWISVSPSSFTGETTGTITFGANSEYTIRTSHINLYGNSGASKVVTVNQAAKPSIQVEPQSVNIPAGGGTISFTVSNTNLYLVDINDSWIIQQSKSGKVVTLNVAQNNTGIERVGTVTVVATGGGSGEIDFTVIQAG